ncbi:hypothetical protein FDP41_010875 [Naegleria fowleri]|uniref:V-SNARE coiled-coil homology domain-containing protein n=1 Tax=Naegleria fowleri TaxID=5763 RepID=A0A6A5C566_NAEFO|nr:uncharacterized protein FDP41_010875 [Naegleria fowleri]KAF0982896.1 hypothetical protein FDP41_010875 [Naegleria fowleri]CAG4709632.1 unnamed protein product [Naegleria fowleri]
MPIKYFLVTDGADVLAESPTQQKLRMILMDKVVPKLERTNHKRVLTNDDNNIYVKYSGRYYYFCIATQEIKQRVCWNLIDEVENETLKNNLDKSLLKEKLKFYNNPDNDKIQKLQNEIDRVRDVMVENVDKILANQETMNGLIETTEELAQQGEEFQRGGRKLKWSMRKRLIIIIVIIIMVVSIILAIIIIILIAYFAPKANSGNNK